jgi:DNA-binding GntR family transcriptional regulator
MRVSRATLVDQVEEVVRWDIIDGVFAPGERLRFADLCTKYGVSATPLREALQRLATQNLIDWDPRLGATVAELSLPEMRDIYWLRDTLEVIAVRRAMANAGDAWVRRVDIAWQNFTVFPLPDHKAPRSSVVGWSDAHRAFHESISDGCGSPWLLRFIRTLEEHSERYRLIRARDARRDADEEHAEIHRAAMALDPDRCVSAVRSHLAATVNALDSDGLMSSLHTPVEPTAEGFQEPGLPEMSA